ncbi:hypothetical protein BBJ29_003480 [Phytophthora kernoviae]|uniref:Uncharacterized protein n=1 Tax=Phytophthora kernoviae TaxID=325452 RepID=A0A3F2S2Z2_9STRA|nr:hypothetical protein BBJ29_003480 [Phytophthora kernoviae]RLN68740.1 hypothetical protein BBP00_00000792 [Phytophthora kernoviae]
MQPTAGPSPSDISMDDDTPKFDELFDADTSSPTDIYSHTNMWGTHNETSETDDEQETLERLAAQSTLLLVACVVLMEEVGAAKCLTVRVALKVVDSATCTEAAGDVSEKVAGLAPRKVVSVSHMVVVTAVKCPDARVVP